VDLKELTAGIKVEMEHTTNERISRKIAFDHLTESREFRNPKYYEMLDLMEELMRKGITKDQVLEALNKK
jgi:hypothetical protein